MSSSSAPSNARFVKTHEYLIPEADGTVRIGITPYAADQLGDVVFVELPAVGTALTPGQSFGVVESVKAVSDLYAPVAGTVAAVNERLADEPALVSEDAFGDGWMLKIAPANPADVSGPDLLTPEAYEAFTGAH